MNGNFAIFFFVEIDEKAIKNYCTTRDVDRNLNSRGITKIKGTVKKLII